MWMQISCGNLADTCFVTAVLIDLIIIELSIIWKDPVLPSLCICTYNACDYHTEFESCLWPFAFIHKVLDIHHTVLISIQLTDLMSAVHKTHCHFCLSPAWIHFIQKRNTVISLFRTYLAIVFTLNMWLLPVVASDCVEFSGFASLICDPGATKHMISLRWRKTVGY